MHPQPTPPPIRARVDFTHPKNALLADEIALHESYNHGPLMAVIAPLCMVASIFAMAWAQPFLPTTIMAGIVASFVGACLVNITLLLVVGYARAAALDHLTRIDDERHPMPASDEVKERTLPAINRAFQLAVRSRADVAMHLGPQLVLKGRLSLFESSPGRFAAKVELARDEGGVDIPLVRIEAPFANNPTAPLWARLIGWRPRWRWVPTPKGQGYPFTLVPNPVSFHRRMELVAQALAWTPRS